MAFARALGTAQRRLRDLCAQLGLGGKSPAVLRRNAITRGVDLASLYDREFEVQGVRFRGMGECKPCYWMDRALGPGAEAALKGRGGLRAKILSDGKIAVGDGGRAVKDRAREGGAERGGENG